MLLFKECRLYLISSFAVKDYATPLKFRGHKGVLIIFLTLLSPAGKSNFVKSEPSVKALNDTSFWKIFM